MAGGQTYQMVRLVNKGKKDFSDGFASQRYTIKAGGEGFVPFDAACLWFGHPDAFDVSERQRARTDMFRRMRQRYGAFDATEKDKDGKDVTVSADELWERNRPRVEVYNLDGERIITVLDDPEGKNVNPADQTQAEQAGLLGRLDALEREGEILRSLLKSQKAAEDNDQDDDQDDDGGDDDEGEDGQDGDEVAKKSSSPSKSSKRQAKPNPRGQHSVSNREQDKGVDGDNGPTATFLKPTDLSPDAEQDSPNRPGVQRP